MPVGFVLIRPHSHSGNWTIVTIVAIVFEIARQDNPKLLLFLLLLLLLLNTNTNIIELNNWSWPLKLIKWKLQPNSRDGQLLTKFSSSPIGKRINLINRYIIVSFIRTWWYLADVWNTRVEWRDSSWCQVLNVV